MHAVAAQASRCWCWVTRMICRARSAPPTSLTAWTSRWAAATSWVQFFNTDAHELRWTAIRAARMQAHSVALVGLHQTDSPAAQHNVKQSAGLLLCAGAARQGGVCVQHLLPQPEQHRHHPRLAHKARQVLSPCTETSSARIWARCSVGGREGICMPSVYVCAGDDVSVAVVLLSCSLHSQELFWSPSCQLVSFGIACMGGV